MILLDISGANAALRKQDTLTCGMVGAKVRFRFDGAWDGLTKTAVFRCGKVTIDSLITGDTAVIPHEALTAPGMPLQIGVYGADEGGALVIPTVWAATCPVRPGADPSGDVGADPTLPVWAEIRAKAETNGQNIEKLTGQVDALRRQAADTIVPPPIVETAAGMTVSAPDSAERPLQGLTLYGKTTQDGTPTPETPVALESAGAGGSISVSVTDGDGNTQTMAVQTPNGLPGIPVSSGGNYTDESGQQWICDEVDFAKGVYKKNIVVFDGFYEYTGSLAVEGYTVFRCVTTEATKQNNKSASLCSHAERNAFDTQANPHFYTNGTNAWVFLPENIEVDVTAIQVIATIDTPIETALSPEELVAYAALHTNYPNTTVYNDAGAGMEMKYVADTKRYIDRQFTQLQNALLLSGANE